MEAKLFVYDDRKRENKLAESILLDYLPKCLVQIIQSFHSILTNDERKKALEKLKLKDIERYVSPFGDITSKKIAFSNTLKYYVYAGSRYYGSMQVDVDEYVKYKNLIEKYKQLQLDASQETRNVIYSTEVKDVKTKHDALVESKRKAEKELEKIYYQALLEEMTLLGYVPIGL